MARVERRAAPAGRERGAGSAAGAAEAIVVGAGHNGLICAAYLARAGVRVLVLEARETIGGAAATVDALGARVNICNCDHSMIRHTPVIAELELRQHGLRYLDVEPSLLFLSWEGEPQWALFHDTERTVESLGRRDPHLSRRYRAYLRKALPLARLILDLGNEVPSAPGVARRLLERRGHGLAALLRWGRRSSGSVARSLFGDTPLASAAVAVGPAAWGLSPATPGTGLGVLSLAMKHAVQTGRPVGGSGALPQALHSALESAGGAVRCGARVERILVESEHVVGVALRGGETVEAPIVISAIDPRTAIVSWLGDVPERMRGLVRKWRARVPRDGYESKLDAVLAEPLRFPCLGSDSCARLGIDDPSVPTTVISPDLRGIAAAHAGIADGRIARRPIFYVNVPSALDPTLRVGGPQGGHLLSLECLFTPFRFRAGWPNRTEARRWLEALAELAAPGFLESVRRWRVMDPTAYESEFHLPRGVPPAFTGSPLSVMIRRDPELTRYETPLRGLFLTGAGTFPGSGIWGAAGRNAALVALRRLNAGAG